MKPEQHLGAPSCRGSQDENTSLARSVRARPSHTLRIPSAAPHTPQTCSQLKDLLQVGAAQLRCSWCCCSSRAGQFTSPALPWHTGVPLQSKSPPAAARTQINHSSTTDKSSGWKNTARSSPTLPQHRQGHRCPVSPSATSRFEIPQDGDWAALSMRNHS